MFRIEKSIVALPDTNPRLYDRKVGSHQCSQTGDSYFFSGLHLACGLNTGQILFLDPTTMNIITEIPFKDTGFEIQEFNYSLDSLTMAFAVRYL